MAITAAQLEVKFTSSGADKVKGELSGMGDAIKTASSGFENLYSKVSGFADAFGRVGLAGGIALFTKGTMAAWKQVDAVEQATIALRAYEKDARKVDQVLKDLLSFARSDAGKLFLREELFRAAQTMKVAGAETENLTRYVEIMSRSVSTGMATWNDLERVIARVGSTGRLTGIEFELLQQAGYQLDDSLRNTTVTWEELFAALEQGSVTVEGQTETLRGRLMTLNTAIRSIGTAFLGVDSETSQFIDGALGSRLVGGIDLAIDALGRLRPMAGMIGEAFATVLNAISGLAQAFSSLPGPIQSIAVGLLGAIAAWGMFRQAIVLASGAMRAVGLGAFTRMFSPLGLAITGVALVAGSLWDTFNRGERAAKTLTESLKQLDDIQTQLELNGQRRRSNEIDNLTAYLDLTTEIANARLSMFLAAGPQEQQAIAEALGFEHRADAMRWYLDEMNATGAQTERLAEQQTRLGEAMANTQVDATRLGAEVESLWERFMTDRTYSLDDFLTDLELIDVASYRLIGSLTGLGDSLGAVTAGTVALVTQTALLAPQIALVDAAVAKTAAGLGAMTAEMNKSLDSAREMGDGLGSVFRSVTDQQAEDLEALREFIADTTTAMLDLTNNATYLSQVNLVGLGTDATAMAEGFKDAASALDSVLAIYGQIDAMGQKYGQAVSIAEALIGEPGVWGAIDDMLNSGRISLEQYNTAVEAGHAIQLRQAEVEENLNLIRANQLPLLEQTSAAYADQVAQIAAMTDAQEQMVSLGWMDTGMQDRVQQFAELANNLTAIGPAGAEAMQQVVDGIVATDPVLTGMLENLGLIEEQANGDYTINMDAVGAMDSIGMLIESIDALTLAMGGVPPLRIDADVSQADATVRDWAQHGYTGGYMPAIPVDADTAPAQATLLDVPVTFWEVPVDANTGAAAASLNAFEPDPIVVDVSFAVSAGAVVSGAAGDVLAAAGGTNALGLPESVTVTINVQDNASAVILDVGSLLGGLSAASALVLINGDPSNAIGAIAEASNALNILDGQTSTVFVDGDNGAAMAAINEVSAYNGTILATAYVDIVARQIGSGAAIGNNIVSGARSALGIRSPSREFAEIGKYTAMGFEQGFERQWSGMDFGYSVASPSYSGYGAGVAASSGGTSRGGDTFNITVNGGDAAQIRTVFAEEIVPQLQQVIRTEKRGQVGV